MKSQTWKTDLFRKVNHLHRTPTGGELDDANRLDHFASKVESIVSLRPGSSIRMTFPGGMVKIERRPGPDKQNRIHDQFYFTTEFINPRTRHYQSEDRTFGPEWAGNLFGAIQSFAFLFAGPGGDVSRMPTPNPNL